MYDVGYHTSSINYNYFIYHVLSTIYDTKCTKNDTNKNFRYTTKSIWQDKKNHKLDKDNPPVRDPHTQSATHKRSPVYLIVILEGHAHGRGARVPQCLLKGPRPPQDCLDGRGHLPGRNLVRLEQFLTGALCLVGVLLACSGCPALPLARPIC